MIGPRLDPTFAYKNYETPKSGKTRKFQKGEESRFSLNSKLVFIPILIPADGEFFSASSGRTQSWIDRFYTVRNYNTPKSEKFEDFGPV